MKEISFSFFQLLYYSIRKIIYKNYYNTYFLENKYKYKTQIFWECGGGYWSYYCGIVKMIKETYPKEILDKIVWIGSSAGVFPVIIAQYFNDENIDDGMNYILNILSSLSQTWYGGLYKLNPLLLNTFYKNYFRKFEKKIVDPCQKVFCTVLNINILCPLFSTISFCYDFNEYSKFTKTCLTSHGIPFITGPLKTTLFHHEDSKKWYIKRMDGGILTVFFGYIFGYNNFMPYGNTIPVKVIYPNIFRPFNSNYAWISVKTDHIKSLFELGYKDAKMNIKKIDELIL